MAVSSPRSPLLPAALWQRVLLGVGWLGLAMAFVQPPADVLRPNLDSSIHASYAYFTAHDLQFGTEVNTTAGPYGFVAYGWDYSGDLYWKRWGLIIGYCLGLSAMVWWFFLACRGGWLRWLWVAGVPCCATFGDNIYNLPVLLGGLFLILTLDAPGYRWAHTLAAILLAFVALTKGTALAVVLVVLAILAGQAWWTGAGRRLGWVAASFAAALAGWWSAAGQNPLHLPAYLSGIWHISSGYNEAMSMAEPLRRFQFGLALALTLLGFFLWNLWRHRRRPVLAAVCVLSLGLGFVAWKHGYVRADGHVLIFLDLGVLLALSLPVAERIAGVSAGWTVGIGQCAFAALALVISDRGANEIIPGRSLLLLRGLGARWMDNENFVVHPRKRLAGLNARLDENRRKFELYSTRQRVGSRPVDFFGHDFGYVFFTGLNFRPAPMCCGTYHVYNRHFKELNLAHYLDPRTRPDFILLRTQTVDERWAGQDDSLSLRAILERYRPVLIERDPWAEADTVLLEAQPGTAALAPARDLGAKAIKFGEFVDVPAVGADEILLFQVELPYNLWGQLQGLLYKPPMVAMDVEGEGLGVPQQRRLVPGSVVVPSLLSPALEYTPDFLSLYTDRPGKTVRRIRLTTPQPDGFAQQRLRVSFSVVRRPAPLVTASIPRGYPRAVYSEIPDAAEPEDNGVHFYHEHLTHYMHAPASITYNLKGNERAIDLTCGIDEGAYLNGRTDGVNFVFELQREGAPVQELFRRALRPLTVQEDRGLQRLHVEIPAGTAPGSRLVIRTDPGQYNDRGWDWSFITAVSIDRGAGGR